MKRSGVNCAKCGQVNELGKVFCASCGRRLDLSKVNARVIAKAAREPRSGSSRLIRLVVLVLLLVTVSLMLWPVVPMGEVGLPKDAKSLTQKLRGLQDAERNGRHVFEIVSEAEVNAYLEKKLQENEEATRSEGMRLGISEINFQFTPDNFAVVMLMHWGPLQLSYEIKGRPDIVGRNFGLDVQSVRWGHLPLPGIAGDWMSHRLLNVFSEMEREREVIDNLGRCDLGHGRVRLVTRLSRESKKSN